MRFVFGVTIAVMVSVAMPVQAKDASCFTTDDGEYPCMFEMTAKDGSFRISAAGKPTFEVVMEGDGVALVYGTYERGGRSVALPGEYVRADDDPACWDNADTQTRICAW